MRTGSKRLLSTVLAGLGAFFTLLFVLSSWVWTQALDTDTYVSTASVAIDQPQIQAEIAQNIVDAVLGDSPVDENIRTVLEEGARIIVSSEGFHTFWELAQRTMHETLREQFLNNDAQIQNAVIDITPEVNLVLQDVRALDPALARILPASAPSTLIEIADEQRIDDLASAISGLDRVKTLAPIFAFVLFVLAALALGLRRRAILAPVIGLFVTAGVVYSIGGIVSAITRRFVDAEFRETADVIIEHMTSSLTSRTWQLLFVGVLGLVIGYFPFRIFTKNDDVVKD